MPKQNFGHFGTCPRSKVPVPIYEVSDMKHTNANRIAALALGMILLLTGCGSRGNVSSSAPDTSDPVGQVEADPLGAASITPDSQVQQLEPGLSAVSYSGDYGLDAFLEQGGAASDTAVVQFLTEHLGAGGISLQSGGFGCSTLSVPGADGHSLFGRNFDWNACDALVVQSAPEHGYASISTVNLDFLGGYAGQLPEEALTLAALYAPLDGMNDQGLCVAVLMIQDADTIEQDTGKPDLTTTTAVRMLLDQAANVEEALELLEQYDLHASMGMMVHFALSDAQGNSVVVEYVADEMVVTETPVVTNFYLAEGEKQGIGTQQSHTRFEILAETLEQQPQMTLELLRDAMDSVSKDNFGEFESTEWTILYDQTAGEAVYFHRENYGSGYRFILD